MAKFDYVGHLLGAPNPAVTELIIANSQTVTIGDAIKNSGGYAAVCDANDRILGIVVGFTDKNGIDLDSTLRSNYDGTWTNTPGAQTYVASNDNVTDKQIKVKVIADPYALFENDADAAMTAAMRFSFFSLVDEDQVDGDTNSTTVGELQLWKLPNPDDLSIGWFRIVSWLGDSFEPET